MEKINIVAVDGYMMNPGDLSWSPLKRLGHFKSYDRLKVPQVIEQCQAAAALLTNKVVFSADTIKALPNLKYIGVTATGYNIVDLDAARSRGIAVTNVPAYSTNSVAQHTMALMLHLTNHVALHNASVSRGEWANSVDPCYWQRPLTELAGKTLGLVGLGNIGQAVAKIARSFGMKVIACRKNQTAKPPAGVKMVSFEELLEKADVVSLHVPLFPETAKIINAETLKQMKPTAILINTSRGGLMDEPALAGALRSGTIAAAGLDVLTTEPPAVNHPLVGLKNCIMTPHLAWASKEARGRLLKVSAQNLKAFLNGEQLNRVD